MPGKRITQQQRKLYMKSRQQGMTQSGAAAKAGFSERTARNIANNPASAVENIKKWRTRKDPFALVWDEVEQQLKTAPDLLAITLLEFLQDKYPGQHPDSQLRTMQRRVQQWKALYGREREVMFRQEHEPGKLGLSDFTTLKDVTITIKGEPLQHILYHFRLIFSGWSYVKIVLGGESYTALTEGLQEALLTLCGSPKQHRTDSLSAAFKNANNIANEDLTDGYADFCKHYNMVATRNNKGVSHENGGIESPHGHIKRRIKQALLLRGSNDFATVADYQTWLNKVIDAHNKRNAKKIDLEREYLQPLPEFKTKDYSEVVAKVSTSSTIDVARVTYTVPSRLIGQALRVHLFDDRLECYLGHNLTVELTRFYAKKRGTRAKNIDYRHVIKSLARKPQAFRFSKFRDELLPNDNYKKIWQHIEKQYPGSLGCKLIVGVLLLSYEGNCEQRLAEYVLLLISQNKTISLTELDNKFRKIKHRPVPEVRVMQHPLATYDNLMEVANV